MTPHSQNLDGALPSLSDRTGVNATTILAQDLNLRQILRASGEETVRRKDPDRGGFQLVDSLAVGAAGADEEEEEELASMVRDGVQGRASCGRTS